MLVSNRIENGIRYFFCFIFIFSLFSGFHGRSDTSLALEPRVG